jgi:hypothetical protein
MLYKDGIPHKKTEHPSHAQEWPATAKIERKERCPVFHAMRESETPIRLRDTSILKKLQFFMKYPKRISDYSVVTYTIKSGFYAAKNERVNASGKFLISAADSCVNISFAL